MYLPLTRYCPKHDKTMRVEGINAGVLYRCEGNEEDGIHTKKVNWLDLADEALKAQESQAPAEKKSEEPKEVAAATKRPAAAKAESDGESAST